MFEEKTLAKLRGIILAVVLISGTLTVAFPSVLPDAYAAPAGKPAKVVNLQVVVSSSQNLLIWEAPDDNGSPIIGYHIERQSPNSGGYVDLSANTGNTNTFFLDNIGVTPSTTYNYKVSAINAIGEGTSDEQRNVTTLPGPSVTLSTTASDPTNVSPIPVTATFSEDVSGFTIDDIIVTNGVASNFVDVDGTIYTFDVTPSSDGLVSVDVPANIAVDILGSQNTAAETLSITYDGTSPSVVLSTTASDPTNVSPIPVTAIFSKNVSGFTIDDITITNGVASNLAGGPSVYTFDVTPADQGLISVDIDADVATDGVGNGNTAAATLSITYDGTGPSVVLSTTASDPTNVSPIPVTATFSEDVT
ncbi:MAG: Ig-like domain-containing protein, partial [Nitrosopumilaceae archaeon]